METNEVVTEITEVVAEQKNNGLGAAALVVGGSMVAGAVLWNKVLKPVGRWIKPKLSKLDKAKIKGKKAAKETVETVED